jgi:bifunctional non-homologous end joining protein LigD
VHERTDATLHGKRLHGGWHLIRTGKSEVGPKSQWLLMKSSDGLEALVQVSALEIHVWGSQVDDVERPDRLVFDLDPHPAVDFAKVVEAAHRLRDLLLELGLESFARTTGGKGLHLVCPIARRFEWDLVETFCRAVAERLVAHLLFGAILGSLYQLVR